MITLAKAQSRDIRRAIAIIGMTHTGVASAAGIHRQNLSSILAGRRPVSAELLRDIGLACGLDITLEITLKIGVLEPKKKTRKKK